MSETIFYKRATFVAHLPVGHRYTASHAWLAPAEGLEGVWRVGLTKFAQRMLGELVEVRYEVEAGAAVGLGDVVGNIEGFKAVSDLFCVVEGRFEGGNPELADGLEPLTRGVHHTWVYQVKGEPDPRVLDVTGYIGVLDDTIDRMLAKQQAEEAASTKGSATTS
ncbi:MAG: glycine cleavage system protein H [Verrucomicrobiae bacterium]|nr:glycine cleavage system protein H [Verrucomicrobiae bacterium]